jgi:hypothetical protein
MSTTSTAGTTVTVQQLQGVLNDYTIHLTGDDDATRHEGLEGPNTNNVSLHENPPTWPIDHYRVPNYRPVNRELDLEDRPKGSNPVEFAFLTIMFTGVYLNSVSLLQSIFSSVADGFEGDREDLGEDRRAVLSGVVSVCDWGRMVATKWLARGKE